ncbi:MAG: ATP-binding protein [bacterium]
MGNAEHKTDRMTPSAVGADWASVTYKQTNTVTTLIDAINNSKVVVFVWRIAEGWPVEFVSENVTLWGYTSEEIYAGEITWVEMVHPDDSTWLEKAVEVLFENKTPNFSHKYRIITRSGEVRWIVDTTSAAFDAEGNITHYQGVIQDISEHVAVEENKTQLEEKLRQAQRMETIGRLAGGVAHDFNNLLTPIVGFSELLLARELNEQQEKIACEKIHDAAIHAMQLIRHLVAFSRQQVLDMQVLNPAAVVTDISDMVCTLLGNKVRLHCEFDPEASNIEADLTQLQQVIINLAVNARDAMPAGGTFTISVQKGAGDTVRLRVSDTGTGIDAATLPFIFEPFFTTKEENEGTGLGLATVYGIVQQHLGQITVTSVPGSGTTFIIDFPRTDHKTVTPRSHILQPEVDGNGETVLVAEDAEPVRLLVGNILREHGYTVILADSGEEALRIAGEYPGQIDMLLTDVVMKKLNGQQTATELQKIRPQLPVVYMTGYSEDILTPNGILAESTRLLLKPFTMDALLAIVRETIAGNRNCSELPE